MGYIKSSLSQGEEIKHIFKLHWSAKLHLYFLFYGGLIFLSISLFYKIEPITLISAFVFLIPSFMVWIELKGIEHGVTNKRVILKKGIISRKSEEMNINSIETVEITQTVLGRILGYGTLKITGRGVSDLVFKKIDAPLEVEKKIEGIEKK